MTAPDPKRYGYKLPLEALGGVCIKVSIEFPDKLEYRAAFNGAINMLGKWFQWDHTQADYSDIPDLNVEVAQVWSGVLAAASWEECVTFCEQLIACLEGDEDTQEALAELIRTNPAIGDALSQYMREHPEGTKYEKNQPLPAGVTAGNILPPNPDCDPDILWTQCLGVVQTANRMIEDFLETWETYNNSGEVLSDIVSAIPLLGEIADIIGIPGILEYANDLIDSIAENYSADYTLEYEQELACEIFCGARDDCAVSLDTLASIMNARIGSALTLDNGTELLLSLIDMDISGFNVADLYLAAFFNMLKVANLVLPITWGIESYLRVIETFNTPSDDWMLLCEDCPAETCINFVSAVSDGNFKSCNADFLFAQHFAPVSPVPSGGGGWSLTHGAGSWSAPVTQTHFAFQPRTQPSVVHYLRITLSQSAPGLTITVPCTDGSSPIGLTVIGTMTSGTVQEITFSSAVTTGYAVQTDTLPDTAFIQELCFY